MMEVKISPGRTYWMPRKKEPARTWDWFNPDSGEQIVVQEVTPEPKRGAKPKQKTGGYWVRVYPDELWRLTDLSGVDLRVFLALLTFTVPDEPFRFTNKEVSEMLDIQQTQVSRSLRRLRERGLLLELRSRVFLMNPRLVWRGYDEPREAAITSLSSTLDTPSRKDPA